jgi:hypothetical protein
MDQLDAVGPASAEKSIASDYGRPAKRAKLVLGDLIVTPRKLRSSCYGRSGKSVAARQHPRSGVHSVFESRTGKSLEQRGKTWQSTDHNGEMPISSFITPPQIVVPETGVARQPSIVYFTSPVRWVTTVVKGSCFRMTFYCKWLI